MDDWTCVETRELTAEFALAVLPLPQRVPVAAHLLSCGECREEVAALTKIAARLLDIVPGTEPPLGFDQAVLPQVRPRRGARMLAAAVAMSLLVTVAVLGIAGRAHHPVTAAGLVGVFRENGVRVGTLSAGGRPLWVSVRVRGLAASGPLSCQLVGRPGFVESLGSFDLVHGSGNWAAPDPAAIGEDRQARLVDGTGHVIATAMLR